MQRAVLVATFLASASAWSIGCHDTAPPPATPVTTVTLDSGPAVTSEAPAMPDASDSAPVGATDPPDAGSGAPSDDPPPASGDFFACTADSDCVAVPKNSCCNNGFMEAVNKRSVDAYKASFTCKKRKICPMFRIRDTHTTRCAPDSHRCELVRPDGGAGLPAPP